MSGIDVDKGLKIFSRLIHILNINYRFSVGNNALFLFKSNICSFEHYVLKANKE